jgi:hypothetical protein
MRQCRTHVVTHPKKKKKYMLKTLKVYVVTHVVTFFFF